MLDSPGGTQSMTQPARVFISAAPDLREAHEIAEWGSMRLLEADAHLEWTRLHLATGDRAAAREHLDRARGLVRECGYGRREREVQWLEEQVGEGN